MSGWRRSSMLPTVVALTAMLHGCASRPGFVLGGDCELATDCVTPLVCRLGRCREECRGDRDCRAGLVCFREDGLGACELEGETCVLSSDCPTSLVCLMGHCANACETDVDCPGEAECLEVGGVLGCRDPRDECELTSDCDAPLVCLPDHHCDEPCVTDRDCRDGDVCDRSTMPSMCVPPRDGGVPPDAGPEPDGGFADGGVITGPAPASMLAAGDRHTCAIASSSLRCWGSNLVGQLGDGSTMDHPLPTAVATIAASATLVATGVAHTCASTATAVYCWGDNALGQVGDGTLTAMRPSPVMLTGGTATAIAAGRDHTCAIRAGIVECWGANGSGQLGDGTTTPHRSPTPTLALAGTPIELSARGSQTCALLDDGRIQCWGANDYGQLGNGTSTTAPTSTPTLVVTVTDAVEVAVGVTHACARRVGGAVLCWGDNQRGALGDGSDLTMARETPGPVPGLPAAVELAAGGEHVCARTIDGDVYCWGGNVFGQVGVNNLVADPRVPTPVEVLGLGGAATELAAGELHTCARAAGGLRCWGANARGQLGNGTMGTGGFVPVVVTWP